MHTAWALEMRKGSTVRFCTTPINTLRKKDLLQLRRAMDQDHTYQGFCRWYVWSRIISGTRYLSRGTAQELIRPEQSVNEALSGTEGAGPKVLRPRVSVSETTDESIPSSSGAWVLRFRLKNASNGHQRRMHRCN
mmetsp:Transcript_9301/g.18330  ORF Transcript_9301/g.18330 Transcript_9301/m.18330 type:complete len:135 (-) Transcript_9301:722-1126(-)